MGMFSCFAEVKMRGVADWITARRSRALATPVRRPPGATASNSMKSRSNDERDVTKAFPVM